MSTLFQVNISAHIFQLNMFKCINLVFLSFSANVYLALVAMCIFTIQNCYSCILEICRDIFDLCSHSVFLGFDTIIKLFHQDRLLWQWHAA